MYIGNRLRELREAKGLSQGDIERRTGLVRFHISRLENDHAVPALETLEKMARALEMPMYQLFYDGEKRPEPPQPTRQAPDWASRGKGARYFAKLRGLLSRTSPDDRKLLMQVVQKLTSR